jgi:hypothetical protein
MRLSRPAAALAATALVASLSFASAVPAMASVTGIASGAGATFAAAYSQASLQMTADFTGCSRPFTVFADGQYTDGNWWVTLQANCTGYS